MPYNPSFSNLENPRESTVFQINSCSDALSISCSTEECNILNIEDSKGNVAKVVAGTATARIIRGGQGCNGQEDYRRESYFNGDYVQITGLNAGLESVSVQMFSTGIYPAQGQTIDTLFAEIKDAICACSNP